MRCELLLLLAAGAFFLAPVVSSLHNVTAEEKFQFHSWTKKFNKTYNLKEYHRRLHNFLNNKRRIDEHNAGKHSYTLGLNQFSDMSFDEFKKRYLMSEPQNCSATKGSHVRRVGPYPDFMDWRKKGNYVSPVKNQGGCGSCWTFSTTGGLESAVAIATGKLLSLWPPNCFRFGWGVTTSREQCYWSAPTRVSQLANDFPTREAVRVLFWGSYVGFFPPLTTVAARPPRDLFIPMSSILLSYELSDATDKAEEQAREK
ncbi:pro-cathepsin H [Gracilinanus agilis]|uniref:pro-cathepsin H n=1 Tax=Gracilinanus agilis TaxID=191870 RepID=UPI001CFD92E1|nr:pro-cathepsin H [Gracilinanus agilis]